MKLYKYNFIFYSNIMYQFLPITITYTLKESDNYSILETDTGIEAFQSYLYCAYEQCKEIECLYFANELLFSEELRRLLFIKEDDVYYNKSSFDIFNISDDLTRYLLIGYETYKNKHFKSGNNYAYNSELYNIGQNIVRWIANQNAVANINYD